jgi:translation initiation factor IF-1
MLKKGLSPLLTTFGLIALAVTFGVLLMNINFSGNTCTGEEIEFVELNQVAFSCFNNENVKAIIRNRGNTNIKKYIITLNGDTYNVGGELKPGELKQFILPKQEDFNKLTIIPNTCEQEKIVTDLSRCIN